MATGSSKKRDTSDGRDCGGEGDELRPYASSPCYLHELDPSYRDAADGHRELQPPRIRNGEPDPRPLPAAGDRPTHDKK